MNLGTLTIKDLTFKVTSATLRIVEGATPKWWVDIRTEGIRIFGEEWSPRLYGEAIPMPSKRSEIRKGQIFDIPVWYDEAAQEYLFSLYVFSHEGAYQNRIQVTEVSSSQIKVSWIGLCDVHWDDDYGTGLAFECDTWLEFYEEK